MKAVLVKRINAAVVLLLSVNYAFGDTYEYKAMNTVVGEVSHTYSSSAQTLPDIARLHDLGYYEIKRANPDVDTWLPGDRQKVVLPKRFVLPVARHEGIIINIPEMRLYYFPESEDGSTRKVITHPIGIGREGWSTPYVNTKIIQKNTDPHWYPPDSVREHYASEGTILPKIVKPGPDNPLGKFAMRLGLPAYLIHGTNRPFGVGMRVSSGCIRLYPEDIESLFNQIKLGTTVNIVNQPYKLGLVQNKIYLEANPFLDEDAELFDGNLTSVVKMLVNFSQEDSYDVNWELAKTVINERLGIPVEIGTIKRQPVIMASSGETTSADSPDASYNLTRDGIELRLDTNLVTQ